MAMRGSQVERLLPIWSGDPFPNPTSDLCVSIGPGRTTAEWPGLHQKLGGEADQNPVPPAEFRTDDPSRGNCGNLNNSEYSLFACMCLARFYICGFPFAFIG